MMWRSYATGWASFVFIVMFVGISVGCIVFYGMLDRAPPRENIRGFPVKSEFHACDFFDGNWILTYAMDKPGRVIRRLTSDANSNFESILSSEDVRIVSQRPRKIPAVDYQLAVASFRIPCQFPPGRAYYEVTVEFYNNWLQELLPIFAVPIHYPPISFTVLPPVSSGLLLRKF
jgi:hypothetical protein